MEEIHILPAGDAALVVEFGKGIDEETNNKVHALSAYIKSGRIRGVRETLPTFRSLMVFYDSGATTFEKLSKMISRFRPDKVKIKKEKKRRLIVPCCYEGAYAPDIPELSFLLKIERGEIVRLHENVDYKIYMLGFLPGFVYLGGLDERLHRGTHAR